MEHHGLEFLISCAEFMAWTSDCFFHWKDFVLVGHCSSGKKFSTSTTSYFVAMGCCLNAISFLLQRSLAQTLVRSASGLRNSEASSQWVFTNFFFSPSSKLSWRHVNFVCSYIRYVRNLMGHIATYIVEMSSKSNFKSISQQPDILLSVRACAIISFSCLYFVWKYLLNIIIDIL